MIFYGKLHYTMSLIFDVLIQIIRKLDIRSACRTACVCHHWHNLLQEYVAQIKVVNKIWIPRYNDHVVFKIYFGKKTRMITHDMLACIMDESANRNYSYVVAKTDNIQLDMAVVRYKYDISSCGMSHIIDDYYLIIEERIMQTKISGSCNRWIFECMNIPMGLDKALIHSSTSTYQDGKLIHNEVHKPKHLCSHTIWIYKFSSKYNFPKLKRCKLFCEIRGY